jgi:hypothetical protein
MSSRVFSASGNLSLVRACGVRRVLLPAALPGAPDFRHTGSCLYAIHAEDNQLGDDAGKAALSFDAAGAVTPRAQFAQALQKRGSRNCIFAVGGRQAAAN